MNVIVIGEVVVGVVEGGFVVLFFFEVKILLRKDVLFKEFLNKMDDYVFIVCILFFLEFNLFFVFDFVLL